MRLSFGCSHAAARRASGTFSINDFEFDRGRRTEWRWFTNLGGRLQWEWVSLRAGLCSVAVERLRL